MQFRDRTDAGQQLAERLAHLADEDVVVLALPRGGVPVGLEIARELEAPLDVIGVRKIGAPMQPEFGIGAIAEGGTRVLDQRSVTATGASEEAIAEVEDREREELQRRIRTYRGDRELPDLTGRTVIVVDDGLATGVTARAACRAVRERDPARLVLAVPVAAPQSVEALREDTDEVVVVTTPSNLMAIGAWYDRFDQTTDDEVLEMLEQAKSSVRRRTS